MSELRISLIVIGIAVIVAVVVYNKWQERKFKRHAEKMFDQDTPDVLLDLHSSFKARQRVEPVFSSLSPRIPTLTQNVTPAEDTPSSPMPEDNEPVLSSPSSGSQPIKVPLLDEEIDYIARVDAARAIRSRDLLEAQRALLTMTTKSIRWVGLNEHSSQWENIHPDHTGEYRQLKVGIQMADRRGAISPDEMASIIDGLQKQSTRFAAQIIFPDRKKALEKAIKLDQFCADLDMQIGINLIGMANNSVFSGTKIRALAEAAGLTLEEDGKFHRLNEAGVSLFTLVNSQPEPFRLETIKELVTPAVVLLFDVPRVPDGVRAFNAMTSFGKQLTKGLNAQMVDDNGKPLDEVALDRIRMQLQSIYQKMEVHGIPAGKELALRLFA